MTDMMRCAFCSEEYKRTGIKYHERYGCRQNPNRKALLIHDPTRRKPIEPGSRKRKDGSKWPNMYTYRAYVESEETKAKRRATREQRQIRWSDKQKERHSETMRRVAREKPGSYTSSNRGRTKIIEYDGEKFNGAWELEFYKWAKSQDIPIVRSPGCFSYFWNGVRSYFPDFFLRSLGIYVEVKGYETERDRAKWQHFPNRLCVIRSKEINLIRTGKFTLEMMTETSKEPNAQDES